ncbi:MAG TPA: hypothetical protein DDW58_09980 [Clostridiaceae bacterium]|nr:hypothetical protein [Clostridiaceae bacterium]
MKDSLVNKSIVKVIKENIKTNLLLVVVIIGAVLTSLIPPQILKHIIDFNLVPKNNDKLLTSAFAYMAAILFIGVFDFLKEALITIL